VRRSAASSPARRTWADALEQDEAATRQELFDYLARAPFGGLPRELLDFVQATTIPLKFNLELAALLAEANLEEVRRL
jgi:hypothetical protein